MLWIKLEAIYVLPQIYIIVWKINKGLIEDEGTFST